MSNRLIRFRVGLVSTLIIAFFVSCSSVMSDYQWVDINANGFDSRDTLHFTFSLDDTLSLYDIYLCSRIAPEFPYNEEIPIYIEVVSPSGNRYCESIKLPIKVDKPGTILDKEWHYRKGVKAAETGEWKLNILIREESRVSSEKIKGLYGFGLYCKKNEFKK